MSSEEVDVNVFILSRSVVDISYKMVHDVFVWLPTRSPQSRSPLTQAGGAGPSFKITRGNFLGAVSTSFSEAVETSVRSLSSEADAAAAVAVALGRPFRAPSFFPGEAAGLGRTLAFVLDAGLRSRRVRPECGTGARGAVGMVWEESMEARTSSVRAIHGAGAAVWEGRPPLRFLVAASSYRDAIRRFHMYDEWSLEWKTYRFQIVDVPPSLVCSELALVVDQPGEVSQGPTR